MTYAGLGNESRQNGPENVVGKPPLRKSQTTEPPSRELTSDAPPLRMEQTDPRVAGCWLGKPGIAGSATETSNR